MKLDIDWSIKEPEKFDLDKFRRYLRDHGYRQSTIDSYLVCIAKYLQSKKSVQEFLDDLHSRKLAGSTIDNYITSIKKYHDRAQSRNLVKLDFSIAISRPISDFIIRVDESNSGFEG